MDKKQLTETDIRTKFITPALVGTSGAKWNVMTQLREEVFFTKGRVIVRGKTVSSARSQEADCILYFKPGVSRGRARVRRADARLVVGLIARSARKPIQHAIWTVGDAPKPLTASRLPSEQKLREMVVRDAARARLIDHARSRVAGHLIRFDKVATVSVRSRSLSGRSATESERRQPVLVESLAISTQALVGVIGATLAPALLNQLRFKPGRA